MQLAYCRLPSYDGNLPVGLLASSAAETHRCSARLGRTRRCCVTFSRSRPVRRGCGWIISHERVELQLLRAEAAASAATEWVRWRQWSMAIRKLISGGCALQASMEAIESVGRRRFAGPTAVPDWCPSPTVQRHSTSTAGAVRLLYVQSHN